MYKLHELFADTFMNFGTKLIVNSRTTKLVHLNRSVNVYFVMLKFNSLVFLLVNYIILWPIILLVKDKMVDLNLTIKTVKHEVKV